MQKYQTYKGTFFVLVSTFIVYYSVRRAVKSIMNKGAMLNSIVDSIPDMIWAENKTGVYIGANKTYGEHWNVSVEDGNLEPIEEPESKAFMTYVRNLPYSDKKVKVWKKVIDGGTDQFIELRRSAIKSLNVVIGYVYIGRNVTDILLAEQKLKMLKTAVEQSPVSVVIADSKGILTYVNAESVRSSGYSASELLGKTCNVFSSGHTEDALYKDLWNTLKSGRTWVGNVKNKRKNGAFYWEEVTAAPVSDNEGTITHFVSVRKDITQQINQEKLIHEYAYFDQLTLLPNRLQLLEKLSEKLAASHQTRSLYSLLYLDLDDFKRVNETISHDYGDRLIAECASRLKGICKESDFLGRFGGDEFMIIHQVSDKQDVAAYSETIHQTLLDPFVVNGRSINITTSIGAVLFSSGSGVDDANKLLSNVDIALAQAKSAGGGQNCLFEEGMNHQVFSQVLLEEQLSTALANKELHVEYQPQFNVESGKLTGYEALLRWSNYYLGNVSPVEFIPIAEKTGVIVDLGRFVIQQSIRFLSRLNELTGDDSVTVAVNLSPKQFIDKDLVTYIELEAARYSVGLHQLEFEITEGVLIDEAEGVAECLDDLLKLGIKLAMDDFGTGYSSLSYLRTYPFSVVKIDRSFIKDLGVSGKDYKLVKASIALVHSLGLTTLAEGVETSEQLKIIKSLGCDAAQGYLYSKPLPEASAYEFATTCLGVREMQ